MPVCLEADRTVVSYRGHEWIQALGISCSDLLWPPHLVIFFLFLSLSLPPHGCFRQAVSRATAACDPKGHMLWDASAVAKVSDPISDQLFMESSQYWCKLYGARVKTPNLLISTTFLLMCLQSYIYSLGNDSVSLKWNARLHSLITECKSMFCASFILIPDDCCCNFTYYIYGYYARHVMFDIPHTVALCVILFDNLIRMPVWENINRVLSRLIQSSCLEGCWLLLRLQSCLAQFGHTAVLSQAKISVLITSDGQAGQGTHMDSGTLRCR